MKLSSSQIGPIFAPHQVLGHSKCAIQSCCRRSKIICCSENEPSGSGSSIEHCDSKPELQLRSKNAAAVLLSFLWSTSPAAAATAAAELAATATSAPYTPSPMEPGWEIYAGFIAGVVPFIIASYEFGKRILIQRRCPECRGSGLVKRGKVLRKCTQCGGMLPWLGWKMFLFSSPGNGGPLNQPKGQKSIFYSVPPPLPREDNSSLGSLEKEKKDSDNSINSANEP
jgi:hypothetical protein